MGFSAEKTFDIEAGYRLKISIEKFQAVLHVDHFKLDVWVLNIKTKKSMNL